MSNYNSIHIPLPSNVQSGGGGAHTLQTSMSANSSQSSHSGRGRTRKEQDQDSNSNHPLGYSSSLPTAAAAATGPRTRPGTRSGSLDATTPLLVRPTWKQRMEALFSRRFLAILLLGQLLSLCITATTIFTTKLAQGEKPISIPTTQSFLNYLVLGVVYTAITIYKVGFWGWIDIIRRRAFYYMLFAVIDVEGNYFVVKAYSYTSLLSAMLLDAWTIPCVVLLSVFFLKMRFVRMHYLGVILAMVGMGFLIWGDMAANKDFPGSNYLKGDLFCLLGATLYACSNVYQEFLVRQTPLYEVVGQLGFWATILNGCQLAILERKELQAVEWTPEVVGYIVGFDIALFIMYSVSPVLFRLSSATFFNLSLLTSDFYGLIFGILLFNARINKLYPIAYVLIIGGIIVYNIYPAPEPKFNPILKNRQDHSSNASKVEPAPVSSSPSLHPSLAMA